jgi:hypothetical protein
LVLASCKMFTKMHRRNRRYDTRLIQEEIEVNLKTNRNDMAAILN